MRALFRVLLVSMSLLTSGVFELAAALDPAGCCDDAGEQDTPPADCSAGVLCACCPAPAVPSLRDGVTARPPVVVVATLAVVEPSLAASVSDIFHPPRA